MNKLHLLPVLMLFIPLAAHAGSDRLLHPSQATRAGKPFSITAGNARSVELTLSDVIYLGLRGNRSIRSVYLDRIAQKFDLRVAEDSFTPQLRFSGSYLAARNQDDSYRQGTIAPTATLFTPYGTRLSLAWADSHTQARNAGRSRNDGANIAVIQPLLRGAGKEIATAQVRLARLNEQLNRLNLKLTVTQTITRIITTYRALLQAQEQVKIAKESLVRSRELVEVNRAMIAAGRMAEFEIVQTEADVATQELALEDARNQVDTVRLGLLQLLALDLETPVVASEALQARRIDVNPRQALKQAEIYQPAWLTQLITIKQAEINLAVASNNRQWDVSLVGGASQVHDRHEQGEASRTWDNYIGVQVEIPVNDMSLHQAEVQARVNVQTHMLQSREARQELKRDVTNAVRDIATRWRQYEITRRLTELSRRKLAIEREKLAVGRSSNFQVLSFENDLRNAENARLNALITYLNAQAQLDETLGTTLQSWDITLND
ncbi:TolC family protein [Enterobacteriaceae bacterium H11S18]|uniref:TolC family protein n=1 Tax=Dryocola clanedunensis TaxID=2925396 RepID=UPI0022F006B3|nr:TolC family protein [Dryocola clanedunensis]MCT4708828.1 TolC family protein [Dryocola clanedunensis]